MEEMVAQPVQNVDHEGGQVIVDCLNTSVVVRKIFQNFSSTELLQLSLVNKLWSNEARTEIRKRGNVIARVRFTHQNNIPCQDILKAFLSVARNAIDVPFTGVSIKIAGSRKCPDIDLHSTYDVVPDKILPKKVSVEVFGNWLNLGDCPGLLLTEKVFQNCSSVLEELSLYIEAEREEFMEDIIQDCRFPRLKFLKLQEYHKTSNDAYTNYMKELVSRAPRLVELQTEGRINSMLKALEGSSAVILYQHRVHAPFDEILETGIGALRLTKMQLEYTGHKFNFDRFNRITPKLLEASCTTTLRSMDVDAVLAVPLMCYRVCLKNVTDFNMHMNYRQLELYEPWILSVLKDFDFRNMFPNLKKVKICSDRIPKISPDHRSRITALANTDNRDPMQDRATSVKEMRFDRWNFSDVAAQNFSEMFPNIGKLKVVAEEQIQFESIWKNWVDLKELEVRGNLVQTTGNLDSVFCGLFPEEVAELRLKDEEYLKRVNIVPVMPAVTCLRQLKTLSLNHEDFREDAFADGASFMFSKVTALIAFARCPTLAVTLNTISNADPPAMTHLDPYVTVMSGVLDDWDDSQEY